jgi:hypothetical protein
VADGKFQMIRRRIGPTYLKLYPKPAAAYEVLQQDVRTRRKPQSSFNVLGY